jgi:ubiquinone/menaquinone biosynthesis C-methylase UbiE
MDDAREWAASAMGKRPWRTQFFDKIVEQIPTGTPRIMELGSGPGFLAERLLQAHPRIEYVALDYSSAMHTLARERLGPAADRVRFVDADFRQDSWGRSLPPVDVVVTVQAVHELRHKRHARALHATVRRLLRPGGVFLMCDHFVGNGGMTNGELFMTREEHAAALKAGGFAKAAVLLQFGGLILFRAE